MALQGRLLSNLSISGNTISTAGTMGGFPPRRIAQLTVDGVTPDHILLYAGLNDANFYVPPEGFLREYQQLLSRLRQTYPHAQISCGTLILGAVPGTQGSLSCLVQRLAPYNQAIRSAVAQADCQLVDLAAMHSRYDALDAFHPNGTGMAQLARLWLQGMEASSQDRNFF